MPRMALEHQRLEARRDRRWVDGVKSRAQQRLSPRQDVIANSDLNRHVWQNTKAQRFCESRWGIRKSPRKAVVVGAGKDKMIHASRPTTMRPFRGIQSITRYPDPFPLRRGPPAVKYSFANPASAWSFSFAAVSTPKIRGSIA